MPNAADADFYGLEQLLDQAGRDAIQRTREFMTKEIRQAPRLPGDACRAPRQLTKTARS